MHATRQQIKAIETLTKRDDFLAAQKRGSKWVTKAFVLQIHENHNAGRRVGFTVTKKTEKSAVKRNRMKRRMRAMAADTLPLCAKDGLDYILIGRLEMLTRPYAQLEKDLKWALKKLDVYQSCPPEDLHKDEGR